MKKLIILILFLFFEAGFSQSTEDYYAWMVHGKIKKEMLGEAKDIFDVIPNYPKKYFGDLVNYVSVEISAICNGKNLTSVGSNEILTPDQKSILNGIDYGQDINISIKFSYKDPANDVYGTGGKIKELRPLQVKVIPEKEACPDRNFNIEEYLKASVLNKTSDSTIVDKIRLSVVNFTVDEKGEIRDVKLTKSSSDPNLDKLILEATSKMPKWNPAIGKDGLRVKQVFTLPVRNVGC